MPARRPSYNYSVPPTTSVASASPVPVVTTRYVNPYHNPSSQTSGGGNGMRGGNHYPPASMSCEIVSSSARIPEDDEDDASPFKSPSVTTGQKKRKINVLTPERTMKKLKPRKGCVWPKHVCK